ncbi:MAG: hypothetical protein EOP47_01540 [Sphingobacteriaceae bacterium]|nr:MAG: hypothetical protein EOP47_01540 [Sphingobacteriaceae bacterium]
MKHSIAFAICLHVAQALAKLFTNLAKATGKCLVIVAVNTLFINLQSFLKLPFFRTFATFLKIVSARCPPPFENANSTTMVTRNLQVTVVLVEI